MLHIEKKIENRKDLVKRLEELLGTKAQYMRLPSLAYQVGDYTVTKEGALEVDENRADKAIINQLRQEGLLDGRPQEEHEVPEAPLEEKEPLKATQAADEPLEVRISVPLKGHTGATLRNLMTLLYQRGTLLSKATGGAFRVTKALIDTLEQEGKSDTAEQFLTTLEEHAGDFSGIAFADDTITFTGFPETKDPDKIQAFLQLASLMNQQALTQKRIRAKISYDKNEKYAFRIWLIRIGMHGDDYKTTRRILLQNLDGDAAFRNDAMKARWKQNRMDERAKKEMLNEHLREADGIDRCHKTDK
jgi:hypothetical protein